MPLWGRAAHLRGISVRQTVVWAPAAAGAAVTPVEMSSGRDAELTEAQLTLVETRDCERRELCRVGGECGSS